MELRANAVWGNKTNSLSDPDIWFMCLTSRTMMNELLLWDHWCCGIVDINLVMEIVIAIAQWWIPIDLSKAWSRM